MAAAVKAKDPVLDSAVELAREAALEVAERPEDVGEHLGVVVEGERLFSHRFACTARGYRGWWWTVTVARVPRGRTATVCEVELLPGDDAVLAKPWLPWSERLRPGDIGAGDTLPFQADDPRLVPGFTPTGDDEIDRVAIEELALARVRILSPLGRDEAADRWYAGAHGPMSAGALAASAACGSCGFLVPLQGALGTVFGVCANEWSPDDGKVVSLDHGCGAHSETDVEMHASDWPAPDPLIDELDLELVTLLAEPTPGTEPATATVTTTEPDASAVTTTDPDAATTEPGPSEPTPGTLPADPTAAPTGPRPPTDPTDPTPATDPTDPTDPPTTEEPAPTTDPTESPSTDPAPVEPTDSTPLANATPDPAPADPEP